jgi:RimJ/RimL family protein N-acetyltransferase
MNALGNGAASDVVDVSLRDGSTLRLRAPARDDAGALIAFFSDLSEESRYRRFHGPRCVDAELVEHFLDPDWSDRGALVGVRADDTGTERIVAVAEYMRLRDPAAAEVAFAVADELQGHGVATRLLEQLAGRAAEHGIERFVAEVLSENRSMLAVFRDSGFEVTREVAGTEVEVSFPIASTQLFRERVEKRNHVAVRASRRPHFATGARHPLTSW